MNKYPTKNRLMEEIQTEASHIRLICGNTDSYGAEAWSKSQLMQMLAHVQWHIEKILTLTGVDDNEAFYTKCLEAIDPSDPGDAHKFKPFSEVED